MREHFPRFELSIFLLDIEKQSHNMARVSRSKTSESPYRVQVLDRAMAALEVLGARPQERSLVELCNALKLHKSTVHRLMMVLEQHRLVDKNPDTGRYRLGLETVHFCILDDGQVFYVEKVEPERSVRMACTVGSRAPAYCTAVGKAMLAELTDAEVNSIIRHWGLKPITKNTISTAAELKAELRAVRTRGFAVDDEEKEEGLRCVGAAVRGHSGRLIAAISVSGPAFRVTKERVQEIGQTVMRVANDLSEELGYQPAPLEMVRSSAS